MKILITGKGGKSGSWQIRAEQLGAAMGATVKPMASTADIASNDIVVVVKRTPAALIDAIRRSGKPWVYDVVDGWPQPKTGGMDKPQAIGWLRSTLAGLSPAGVIFGTERMRSDAAFTGRSIVLPHHSWSRYLNRTPQVRDQIQVVGYEGAEHYLGSWRAILERECQARGWQLQINGDMTKADIGIALRDGGGYPAQHWKPGTKLSNLHALGIPAICSHEQGYMSVSCGRELFVSSADDVSKAFDLLQNTSTRKAIALAMRQAALPVEAVASAYKEWLHDLL